MISCPKPEKVKTKDDRVAVAVAKVMPKEEKAKEGWNWTKLIVGGVAATSVISGLPWMAKSSTDWLSIGEGVKAEKDWEPIIIEEKNQQWNQGWQTDILVHAEKETDWPSEWNTEIQPAKTQMHEWVAEWMAKEGQEGQMIEIEKKIQEANPKVYAAAIGAENAPPREENQSSAILQDFLGLTEYETGMEDTEIWPGGGEEWNRQSWEYMEKLWVTDKDSDDYATGVKPNQYTEVLEAHGQETQALLAAMREVIRMAPGSLWVEGSCLSKWKHTVHDFEVRKPDRAAGERPAFQNPYPMAPTEVEELRKQVEKMVKQDLAEWVSVPSEHAAPAIMVRRQKYAADGTRTQEPPRFVVNYKRLNALMIPDAYPMARTDDVVFSMAGGIWFSKKDLCSGYWQVAISENAQEKSRTITPLGMLQWKVAPFGLENMPMVFQRAMTDTFNDEIVELFVGERQAMKEYVEKDAEFWPKDCIPHQEDYAWSQGQLQKPWQQRAEQLDTMDECVLSQKKRVAVLEWMEKKSAEESKKRSKPTNKDRHAAVYTDDLAGKHDGPWNALRCWARELWKAEVLGMQFKPKKCEIFCKEMDVVGTMVCEEGRAPSMERAQGVSQIAYPKTRSDLPAFVGFLGWYRDWIEKMSDRTLRLREEIAPSRKAKPFVMTEEMKAEFDDVKMALESAVLLAWPDSMKKKRLMTDASKVGLGVVLEQYEGSPGTEEENMHVQSKWRPVSSAARNYLQHNSDGQQMKESYAASCTELHKHRNSQQGSIST